MQKYEENYNRACALILKHGAKSKRGLLNHYLDKSRKTLYQFVELNGHDILHLHVGRKKCCRCQNLVAYGPPNGQQLYRSQMNVLFSTHGHLPVHREGVLSSDYCCRYPKTNIDADSLDISLLNSLFTHFCNDLFWENCIQEKTFETFLNDEKHTLYHLWRIKQPCCFQNCPSLKKQRINGNEWNKLFDFNPNLSVCHKGEACSCNYKAKSGIQIKVIDKDLVSEILHWTSSLKQAVEGIVELRNTYIAHATANSLSDMKFDDVLRRCRKYMKTIATECQSDISIVEGIIENVKEMPLDSNTCTQMQTILLSELVEKTDVNKTLENHEGKLDEIDEKNDRNYEQGQKILKNQARIIAELSKPKWYETAFKNFFLYIRSLLGDDSSDLFKCGLCKIYFTDFNDFFTHKEEIHNQPISIRAELTMTGSEKSWEENTMKFCKQRRGSLNVENLELEGERSGSVVFVAKLSAVVISSTENILNTIQNFLIKLFQKCPLPYNNLKNIEIKMEVCESYSDEQDENCDIYHCGRCQQNYYSLGVFLLHKESAEHKLGNEISLETKTDTQSILNMEHINKGTKKGQEGVEKVLSKNPIHFGDTIVEAKAYLSDELLKNEESDSDDYNTPPESYSDDENVCTIEVSGLKKATTENTIMFYFEGKNGANADIKNIKRTKENNVFLVTFENAEDLKIKIKGISSSVMTAKLKMYEVTGSISSISLGSRSPEFIQFLENPKVTKSVLKRMMDHQCIGVWKVHNMKITLYATSDEEVSKAADVFKNSIIETKVDGDNLQKSLLQSKKWIQHLKAIEDECHRKLISVKIIADKQGEIVLLCTSKAETAIIKEEILTFFYSNTEIELKLELEKPKLKFLQEYMQDEVKNLECHMKQQHIIVAVKSDNVLVKANQEGIQEAQKCLDALVNHIYRKEHPVDKPGLQKLMDTDKGKSKLRIIGKQAGVVISIKGGERSIQGSKSSTDEDGKVVYCAAGGQEVIVIKADITALSVDVIVNAANKDLVHSGGLAKVLINKGGISIQHECDQYTKHHGQLSEGEVFCSGPGSLHCKYIVHAVGPIWQGGRNKEELYVCVTTSLEEADKRNLLSIAIPALCTGIFGYPASEATNVITESVRDYFKRPHSSSIKTVFLCDIVTNTVDLFVKAGNKFFNQPDSKHHSTPGRGRSTNRFSEASHNKGRQNITTRNIKIKILKEDLNKMKVDVIVNTTTRNLKLSKGIVSASLLKHGGPVLQRECNKKHPNGVEYGELVVTSGGRLHCKIVYHGSLEQWKSDGSSIKAFESFIMKCLQTADKKGFRSIAFPALGTGKLNYPRDLVAKHMYKCVEDFSSKNPKSTITEVFFVLYHRDHLTVQAFEDQKKIQLKSSVKHETPTTFQRKGNKKPEDGKVYSINLGKVVMKVYQGDITAAQVEVIVNNSNTNLDMSLDEVSKAILQKGGDKIKKRLLTQKTDMKNDGIAVTTCKGSGLLCDVVIHVDMQETTLKLKEKITHVLEKAEELGKISVAFPALGTSNANITIKDAAEEMYSAVRQFQSTSPQHVKEVHVVIFKNDQMKTFMETIKACVSTGNKKGWMDYVYDCAMDYLGYGQLSDKQTKILTEDRPKMSSDKQSTAVTFVIYAKNKKEAERAVTVLESELDHEYVSRKIKDRMVAELNPEQITALKFIRKSHNVEIHVDKGNKEIVLTGIIDNISSAMSAANKIIQTAQEQKQLNQKAKLVTDMVQWSFVEELNGKKSLVEFPHDVNILLEEAFRDDSSKLTFLASDGSKMVIDLTSYKIFPEDDPMDDNGVIRKTKLVSDSDFKQPEYWDDMADDEYIKMVPLVQSSKEYADVLTDFNKTGGTSHTVVKIERVQNKVLNQQYIAKKSLMDATNSPGYQNERRPVWHGTNKKAIENIINTGFNRSYCNVTAYGKGVYFAVNVSYSAGGYSTVDPTDGLKRMLMCKVLAGEYTVGNSSMRTPPPKTQSAAGSHILYDSTTNSVSSPGMYVIYHDSQAVAEYLVTFK